MRRGIGYSTMPRNPDDSADRCELCECRTIDGALDADGRVVCPSCLEGHQESRPTSEWVQVLHEIAAAISKEPPVFVDPTQASEWILRRITTQGITA